MTRIKAEEILEIKMTLRDTRNREYIPRHDFQTPEQRKSKSRLTPEERLKRKQASSRKWQQNNAERINAAKRKKDKKTTD